MIWQMSNIVSFNVDYISNLFILKLRLNKGIGWTQNIRDPKWVTPHEHFNVHLRREVGTPVASPDELRY
jgi:hypothetical protein